MLSNIFRYRIVVFVFGLLAACQILGTILTLFKDQTSVAFNALNAIEPYFHMGGRYVFFTPNSGWDRRIFIVDMSMKFPSLTVEGPSESLLHLGESREVVTSTLLYPWPGRTALTQKRIERVLHYSLKLNPAAIEICVFPNFSLPPPLGQKSETLKTIVSRMCLNRGDSP